MADDNSHDQPAARDGQTMESQPGAVITPGTVASPDVAPSSSADNSTPTQNSAVQLSQDDDLEIGASPVATDEAVSWTASEFVAHDKSIGWYGSLAIVTVIVGFLIWLLTKSLLSVIVVLLSAVVLAVFGSRKPRELHYTVDSDGLMIEQKLYNYHDFKSFSVIPEGAFSSIVFVPLKRFMPPLTIYYDPADEASIVAVLASRIPLEAARPDVVDRFVSRIRF